MADSAEDHNIQVLPSEEEDRQVGVPLYRIVSYPADYTVYGLYQKLVDDELIISKFQRHWVWDQVRASRLIESFIVGLPVPGIFLYREPSQKHLIVDGQQRLRSIRSFFEGTLPDGKDFYLKGVDSRWEGKRYTDLTPEDNLRLRDSVLRATIIEQLNPADKSSVYHIFERLNTGSVSLTPQEIRNCVSHGPFNDLMVRLNLDATWRRLFGIRSADARMRDVELIVRFLALFESYDRYEKPMKTFLNRFMEDHQWETATQHYEHVFLNTVKSVMDALGPKPFHIKRGINVAAYDSVMVAFANSTHIPSDVPARFERLKTNPSYQESITAGTTDVDTVKNRINLARVTLFK